MRENGVRVQILTESTGCWSLDFKIPLLSVGLPDQDSYGSGVNLNGRMERGVKRKDWVPESARTMRGVLTHVEGCSIVLGDLNASHETLPHRQAGSRVGKS